MGARGDEMYNFNLNESAMLHDEVAVLLSSVSVSTWKAWSFTFERFLMETF